MSIVAFSKLKTFLLSQENLLNSRLVFPPQSYNTLLNCNCQNLYRSPIMLHILTEISKTNSFMIFIVGEKSTIIYILDVLSVAFWFPFSWNRKIFAIKIYLGENFLCGGYLLKFYFNNCSDISAFLFVFYFHLRSC